MLDKDGLLSVKVDVAEKVIVEVLLGHLGGNFNRFGRLGHPDRHAEDMGKHNDKAFSVHLELGFEAAIGALEERDFLLVGLCLVQLDSF